MAAPIIQLRSTDEKQGVIGAPRVIAGSLENLTANQPLPGGGGASVDVGGTPAGVPNSGWSITAGTNSGFMSCRVRAVFTGNGTGADGYFVVSGGGLLSALVVTSQGSGYTGVVTVAPFMCGAANIVFDLGAEWHQYTTGVVSFTGLPTTDSIMRVVNYGGREANITEFMLVYFNRSGGGVVEAFIQPFSGGSPGYMVRLGARYITVTVLFGMSTGNPSCTLIAYPN